MTTHAKSKRATRKRSSTPKSKTRQNDRNEIAVTITGVNGQPLTIYAPNEEAVETLLRDEELYNRYAKHLEATRNGEFVAIGLDGELIVRRYMNDAFVEAHERFGPRCFALHRIGYDEVMTFR